MYLVTAATVMELEAFTSRWEGVEGVDTLVTGVGPVEAAMRTALYLAAKPGRFAGVVNLGIGGAYERPVGAAGLLDLCLAEREVLGDFGICYDHKVQPFEGSIVDAPFMFQTDPCLTERAGRILEEQGLSFKKGTFVTVNGVSATAGRGAMLAAAHDGLCENMEGAAVARVCEELSIPLVEVRCISNMVEDRNRQNWKIKEAVQRCGAAAALIVGGMCA